MGLIDWMFGKKETKLKPTYQGFKIITDLGEGFYRWDGNIYKSDIVRSCIRPKARAVGKMIAQHIRDNEKGFQTNPDNNIKFLLSDPNPLMSGQMLQEKLITQLELNNNAFALIKRDPNTFQPIEIYPIPATNVDMLEGPSGDMYLKFYFSEGSQLVAPYSDIIHLRKDFNNHNLFGDSPAEALVDLMEVVTTIDQGMMKAIKNSAIIKWIMKFANVLKQEDVEEQVETFTRNFLKIENSGGAVPSDPRYELEQVKPESYVPDDKQMNTVTKRIYDFFNTNEKIVQSKFNEDEWNAYYEAVVEPDGIQLTNEYTRKIFTRRERGHGNKIIFEASNLQYASMSTKLGLEKMVDRGALTPNEWRRVLNLAPIEGGDKPIRRLDTAEVKGGEDNQGKDGDQGSDNG